MGIIHYVRPGSKRRILNNDTPKWITNNPRAPYIKQVVLSAPLWMKPADIAALHALAVWRTEMTGTLHVLDHIVPVRHPDVCGLTVPWNLRVIPWIVNGSKGNTWQPEQLELFGESTSHSSTPRYMTDFCEAPRSQRANLRPTAAGYGPDSASRTTPRSPSGKEGST